MSKCTHCEKIATSGTRCGSCMQARINELEADNIKLRKMLEPVSFLPECKWKRNANNVTYCTDTGCKLFDKPCSKRCDCPEPEVDND
jgi:hypothetical protein